MIVYIALFIMAFALLQMFIALVNLLFKERLHKNGLANELPTVSLVIPARDEELNIELLLGDLTSVSDRILEIVVYDDQSTDKTADVVDRFSKNDSRIRLLNGIELPAGWTGKNHACYQLALEAKGDFLLFLDADVRLEEGVIKRTLDYMIRKRCDLMSIFPTQEMLTVDEKITVPNMQIILLSLLPLPLVRLSGFSSLSAANGQFMLFKGITYKEFEPHLKFKKSRAEDIEIARYYKRSKLHVSCLTGIKGVRCRMYNSISNAVEGFSKNVTHFFGNSSVAAVLYWLITTLGFIVLLVAGKSDWFWIWITAVLLTRIFISLTAGMRVIENIILFIPQQILLGVFILRAIINKRKKTFRWKGRAIL